MKIKNFFANITLKGITFISSIKGWIGRLFNSDINPKIIRRILKKFKRRRLRRGTARVYRIKSRLRRIFPRIYAPWKIAFNPIFITIYYNIRFNSFRLRQTRLGYYWFCTFPKYVWWKKSLVIFYIIIQFCLFYAFAYYLTAVFSLVLFEPAIKNMAFKKYKPMWHKGSPKIFQQQFLDHAWGTKLFIDRKIPRIPPGNIPLKKIQYKDLTKSRLNSGLSFKWHNSVNIIPGRFSKYYDEWLTNTTQFSPDLSFGEVFPVRLRKRVLFWKGNKKFKHTRKIGNYMQNYIAHKVFIKVVGRPMKLVTGERRRRKVKKYLYPSYLKLPYNSKELPANYLRFSKGQNRMYRTLPYKKLWLSSYEAKYRLWLNMSWHKVMRKNLFTKGRYNIDFAETPMRFKLFDTERAATWDKRSPLYKDYILNSRAYVPLTDHGIVSVYYGSPWWKYRVPLERRGHRMNQNLRRMLLRMVISDRQGFQEGGVYNFTHASFPKRTLHDIILKNKRAIRNVRKRRKGKGRVNELTHIYRKKKFMKRRGRKVDTWRSGVQKQEYMRIFRNRFITERKAYKSYRNKYSDKLSTIPRNITKYPFEFFQDRKVLANSLYTRNNIVHAANLVDKRFTKYSLNTKTIPSMRHNSWFKLISSRGYVSSAYPKRALPGYVPQNAVPLIWNVPYKDSFVFVTKKDFRFKQYLYKLLAHNEKLMAKKNIKVLHDPVLSRVKISRKRKYYYRPALATYGKSTLEALTFFRPNRYLSSLYTTKAGQHYGAGPLRLHEKMNIYKRSWWRQILSDLDHYEDNFRSFAETINYPDPRYVRRAKKKWPKHLFTFKNSVPGQIHPKPRKNPEHPDNMPYGTRYLQYLGESFITSIGILSEPKNPVKKEFKRYVPPKLFLNRFTPYSAHTGLGTMYNHNMQNFYKSSYKISNIKQHPLYIQYYNYHKIDSQTGEAELLLSKEAQAPMISHFFATHKLPHYSEQMRKQNIEEFLAKQADLELSAWWNAARRDRVLRGKRKALYIIPGIEDRRYRKRNNYTIKPRYSSYLISTSIRSRASNEYSKWWSLAFNQNKMKQLQNIHRFGNLRRPMKTKIRRYYKYLFKIRRRMRLFKRWRKDSLYIIGGRHAPRVRFATFPSLHYRIRYSLEEYRRNWRKRSGWFKEYKFTLARMLKKHKKFLKQAKGIWHYKRLHWMKGYNYHTNFLMHYPNLSHIYLTWRRSRKYRKFRVKKKLARPYRIPIIRKDIPYFEKVRRKASKKIRRFRLVPPMKNPHKLGLDRRVVWKRHGVLFNNIFLNFMVYNRAYFKPTRWEYGFIRQWDMTGHEYIYLDARKNVRTQVQRLQNMGIMRLFSVNKFRYQFLVHYTVMKLRILSHSIRMFHNTKRRYAWVGVMLAFILYFVVVFPLNVVLFYDSSELYKLFAKHKYVMSLEGENITAKQRQAVLDAKGDTLCDYMEVCEWIDESIILLRQRAWVKNYIESTEHEIELNNDLHNTFYWNYQNEDYFDTDPISGEVLPDVPTYFSDAEKDAILMGLMSPAGMAWRSFCYQFWYECVQSDFFMGFMEVFGKSYNTSDEDFYFRRLAYKQKQKYKYIAEPHMRASKMIPLMDEFSKLSEVFEGKYRRAYGIISYSREWIYAYIEEAGEELYTISVIYIAFFWYPAWVKYVNKYEKDGDAAIHMTYEDEFLFFAVASFLYMFYHIFSPNTLFDEGWFIESNDVDRFDYLDIEQEDIEDDVEYITDEDEDDASELLDAMDETNKRRWRPSRHMYKNRRMRPDYFDELRPSELRQQFENEGYDEELIEREDQTLAAKGSTRSFERLHEKRAYWKMKSQRETAEMLQDLGGLQEYLEIEKTAWRVWSQKINGRMLLEGDNSNVPQTRNSQEVSFHRYIESNILFSYFFNTYGSRYYIVHSDTMQGDEWFDPTGQRRMWYIAAFPYGFSEPITKSTYALRYYLWESIEDHKADMLPHKICWSLARSTGVPIELKPKDWYVDPLTKRQDLAGQAISHNIQLPLDSEGNVDYTFQVRKLEDWEIREYNENKRVSTAFNFENQFITLRNEEFFDVNPFAEVFAAQTKKTQVTLLHNLVNKFPEKTFFQLFTKVQQEYLYKLAEISRTEADAVVNVYDRIDTHLQDKFKFLRDQVEKRRRFLILDIGTVQKSDIGEFYGTYSTVEDILILYLYLVECLTEQKLLITGITPYVKGVDLFIIVEKYQKEQLFNLYLAIQKSNYAKEFNPYTCFSNN